MLPTGTVVPLDPSAPTASAAALAVQIAATPTPAAGAPPGIPTVSRQYGVVQSIQVGPPPTVTITLGGSAVPVPGLRYFSSYSPTAGDTVVVDHVGTDVVVVGGFAGAADSTPAGVIFALAAGATPAGYLICDGTSYGTATYPRLYAAIGTTWGGSGSNFNVPLLSGRTLMGSGNSGAPGAATHSVAATGGEEKHTLTSAELASHTHPDAAHSHLIGYGTNTGSGGSSNPATGTGTSKSSTDAAYSGLGSSGSSTPFNVLSPYGTVIWIIRF